MAVNDHPLKFLVRAFPPSTNDIVRSVWLTADWARVVQVKEHGG